MKKWGMWSLCVFFGVFCFLLFFGSLYSSSREQNLPEQKKKERALQIRSGAKKVRSPAGAGTFYPADPQKLYQTVEKMLASKSSVGIGNAQIIHVPHAGYIYSGEVAASAFRELNPKVTRVFILAANHSGEAQFSGVSIPPVTHYAIPGLEIGLDAVADKLVQSPLFIEKPEAHGMYMVEVELPFLHVVHGRHNPPKFTIVPMILGQLSRAQIKQLAITLSAYADEETAFVFSVDLSHFYTAKQAERLDAQSIDAVMSRDRTAIEKITTDGNHVLMTMVELADLLKLDATSLDYRHSGMVTHDNQRVVGYGAIAFHEPVRYSREDRKRLLQLARQTISDYLDKEKFQAPQPLFLSEHPVMQISKGLFVTLKKKGRLRGCIGELIGSSPLYKGIQRNAIKAATADPRFQPVSKEELKELRLSISVLEYPRQVLAASPSQYPKLIKPHEDGVILTHKGRRSTYLPEVWQQIPDPQKFLSQLCLKQGSPPSCWKDQETTLYSYRATVLEEEDVGLE